MPTPPVVWTIAGFDPSSGAGITADIKTISAFGCYGVSCITAITVQNTLGVRRISPISPQTVREILHVLLDDFSPTAIKIGMLATVEIVASVSDFLEALPQPRCPIVLDPIMHSSSGAQLLNPDGVSLLRSRLLPLAIEAPNGDASDALAYSLQGMDFVETLSAPRIASNATHGTGCAFSTAIACALAKGQNVPSAVTSAKAFVRRAIQHAPGIGHGKGPMGLDRATEG